MPLNAADPEPANEAEHRASHGEQYIAKQEALNAAIIEWVTAEKARRGKPMGADHPQYDDNALLLAELRYCRQYPTLDVLPSLLAVVHAFARERGACRCSAAQLGQLLGRSDRAIRAAIVRGQEAGLLCVERGGRPGDLKLWLPISKRLSRCMFGSMGPVMVFNALVLGWRTAEGSLPAEAPLPAALPEWEGYRLGAHSDFVAELVSSGRALSQRQAEAIAELVYDFDLHPVAKHGLLCMVHAKGADCDLGSLTPEEIVQATRWGEEWAAGVQVEVSRNLVGSQPPASNGD
jgi:hypothetical protein